MRPISMGEKARSIGPVLLTGGNGFIAYHIIATIPEEDPDCVITRSVTYQQRSESPSEFQCALPTS
jgi:nucleoside-diphosphate-sugar epimerase